MGGTPLDLTVRENVSEPGSYVITIPATGAGGTNAWSAATITELENPGDTSGTVIDSSTHSRDISELTLSGGLGDGTMPNLNTGNGSTVIVEVDSAGGRNRVDGGTGEAQLIGADSAEFVLDVSVTATDAAGNTATDVDTVDDFVHPFVPVIDPSDGTVITGTGEPGSTVNLDTDGDGVADETALVQPDGMWSVTPATPVAEGVDVTATQTDAAGNESLRSEPVQIGNNDADGDGIPNDVEEAASTQAILADVGNDVADPRIIRGETVFVEDFGTGEETTTPFTNLTFNPVQTEDGEYSVVQNTRDAAPFPAWEEFSDNTGNAGGRMLVVNADFEPSEVYNRTISNLSADQDYAFGAFIRNVILPNPPEPGVGVLPNVTFQIFDTSGNLIASVDSGDIPNDSDWKELGLIFNSGANTELSLIIVNNAPGGNGNDFAIDDITLTEVTVQPDFDNDNIIDSFDTDSDNDGIVDAVEGAGDSDNDGLADFVDLDSDNNGISDREEAAQDASEIADLAANNATFNGTLADGDTFILADGGAITFDLTAIDNANITDVERIDITGDADNTLTITAQDVLDLSSTSDEVIVLADTGDTVNATGFTASGEVRTINGQDYNVFEAGGATLIIDQDATTNL